MIQGGKLYRDFLARHPKEAGRLIPFAFSSTMHPEKVIFFLRKTSRPVLRADPNLWRLRQRVILLLLLSLLAPIACFVFLCTCAIFEKVL